MITLAITAGSALGAFVLSIGVAATISATRPRYVGKHRRAF